MTDLISVPDAARAFGRSRSALRKAIHRGRLPARRIGGTWILTTTDVADYIASTHGRGRRPDAAKGRRTTW